MIGIPPQTGVCPNCGARSASLTGDGLIVTFGSSDYRALAALFGGAFDEIRCDVCNERLDVTPTVVFIGGDPPTVEAFVGSRLTGRADEPLEGIISQVAASEVEARQHSSLDEFRAGVAARLKPTLNLVTQLVQSVNEDTVVDYAHENWRELTPSAFAAAHLVVTAPVPGVVVGALSQGEADASGVVEVFLVAFAAAQTTVWIALTEAWLNGLPRGDTLAEDLDRYIHPGAVLPRAAEGLSDALDKVWTSDTRPLVRYVIEAVRASVLAAAGAENPYAGDWAELYFRYELDMRLASEEPPEARALAVGAERARATVSRRPAWDAVARRLPTNRETLDALRDVVAAAGHETLVEDVLSQGMRVTAPSIEALEEPLREVYRRAPEPQVFLAIARTLVKQVVASADVEGFTQVLALVEELLPNDPETRGMIEAWAGSYYKEMRDPERVLARIGDQPEPWEEELSDDVRIDLWTERSNALRLAGRPFEALDVAERVLALISPDDHRLPIAKLNVGILQRETGAPDESARLIAEILGDVGSDESLRIGTLDSLATSYASLGRYADAVGALDEALAVAQGPFADRAPKLRIARASMLTLVGREADAATMLAAEELDPARDPLTFLSAAAAWITVLMRDPALAPHETLDAILGGLDQVHAHAAERNDLALVLGVLDVRATLAELTGDDAESRWRDAAQAMIDAGRSPDAVQLVWLATHRYRQEDPTGARTLLRSLPRAMLDTHRRRPCLRTG